MISNCELTYTYDHQFAGKKFIASWYAPDKLGYQQKMQYQVYITDELFVNSYADPYIILRKEFAKGLKQYPEVLYMILHYIDVHTGESTAVDVDLTDTTKFDYKPTLSEMSKNIYNETIETSKIADVEITWKLDDKLSGPAKAMYNSIIKYGIHNPNYISNTPLSPVDEGGANLVQNLDLSSSAKSLPGVREKVKFPCGKHSTCLSWTGKEYTLYSNIIKLNDSCKWTREEIADWLETLDIDLTFKS